MATELDTFLASLRGATSDIAGVTDRMKAMDKERALKEAYGAAPEMIRAGQGLEAGAQLAQAGDPFVMREILQQSLKPQKAKVDPNLAAQAFGLGKDVIPILEQSEDPFEAAQKISSQGLQREGIGLQKRSQTRLERGEYGKPEKWFDDPKKGIRAVETQIAELDKTFSNVKESLKKGTQPADAIVFNFMARFVAGEKGPLAEGDIDRLMGKYAEGTLNAVEQYITSEGKSTLTAPQRRAFQELYDMTVNNYDKYKENLIGSQLTDALRYEGTLFNPETGKLDRRAQRYFNKFGYKVENVGDDFVASKKTEKREVVNADQSAVSGSLRQGGNEETEVTKIIEQIKDPKVKAQAQQALKDPKLIGKKIPQSLINRFKEAAGAQ